MRRGGFATAVLVGVLLEALVPLAPVIAIVGAAYLLLMPSPVQDRVVLLPGPDGKVGEVLVKSSAGEEALNTAYAGIGVNAEGKIIAEKGSAEAIKARYGAVLEANPPRPKSYVVYFVSGSATELDITSRYVIETMKAELAERPEPEITVIGHTDTVGELEVNDALSAKRAETVRDLLIATGVRGTAMQVAGRGEREPMIPTADEVADPMNRRVEINVR